MTEMTRNAQPSSIPQRLAGPTMPALAQRVDELRATARLTQPEALAQNIGATFMPIGPNRGEIHLTMFGAPVCIAFPELLAYNDQDDPLSEASQALLMYHLITADGTPQTGKYISFADIPGGRIYAQAFQGYSGDKITKACGENILLLEKASIDAGGKKIEHASLAYQFQALPQVPLQVIYWQGDEDFPSSCKILFDQAVSHYLPIDVCAILGGILAGKIIKKIKEIQP